MRKLALIICTALLLNGCGDEESAFDLAVQGIYSGSLSSDGRFALIGSINHGGSYWNLKQEKRLYNWNHQAGSYSFIVASALSGDGRVAVTADARQGLVFWNTGTGKSTGYWRTPAEVNSIALDQTGQLALVGLADHQVLVLDRSQGGISKILKHDDIVNIVALTPDGRFGISGSDDQQVKLWDIQQGTLLVSRNLGHKVVSVAISQDGQQQFAAAQSRAGQLFSGRETTAKAQIGLERQTQTRAQFSANGKQLLTGTSAGDVYLWNAADGKKSHSWHLGRKDIWKPTGVSVRALAFQGGQRYQALGSNGRSYSLSQ